ncbi:MerR family transcriptional regulator [Desulfovermiculus halophilus]|uniref:MerR family transcriptional regulator n=1 Tax=Desulfovermiculus halophilus TaxID=339722 RepID=UPI00047F4E69|nr:MerR family transcriptional regulator [Desulfovermiculus halophilus]
MASLLTIKEIAKQLQVPESNIRYYRDRFEEYIPSIGQGRRRRYKKEAVDVFGHIVQGYKDEKNTEQIAAELAEMFPRTVSVSSDLQPAGESSESGAERQSGYGGDLSHPVLQAQSRTLEHLAQALAENSMVRTEFTRVRDEQEKLRKGLLYLWRMQKTGTQGAQRVQSGEEKALAQDLRSLEQRVARLEERVGRELEKMRSEIRECVLLTREFVQSSDGEKK